MFDTQLSNYDFRINVFKYDTIYDCKYVNTKCCQFCY